MSHSLSGLMKFLQRDDWEFEFDAHLRSHLEPACHEFDLEPADLGGYLGESAGTNLWGCIFEDFLTRETEDGRNVAEDYLKRRGFKETATNKAYIRALRSSVMSLYEVSEIERDKGFLARDLLRGGEPVYITERSATHSLKPWDRIGARVVQVGKQHQMSGGVIPLRFEDAEGILESLRRMQEKIPEAARHLAKERKLAIDLNAVSQSISLDTLLKNATPLFITSWLSTILDHAINKPRPTLANTDGDPIEYVTVRFPVTAGADPAALTTAIGKIPDVEADGESRFIWRRPETGAGKRRPPGSLSRAVDIPGSVTLGNIEIGIGAVELNTNSRNRAERGTKLLARALGALADMPATSFKSVDEMMAERKGQDSDTAGAADIPAEEKRAVIHAFMEQHYRQVLDQPVPVLGDRTPREAVRTESGRMQVVNWLKALENANAQRRDPGDPMASYDTGWLWQELGVGELRV